MFILGTNHLAKDLGVDQATSHVCKNDLEQVDLTGEMISQSIYSLSRSKVVIAWWRCCAGRRDSELARLVVQGVLSHHLGVLYEHQTFPTLDRTRLQVTATEPINKAMRRGTL